MSKFIVEFDADTEGNWCSQCTGISFDSRAAAQAAIDADETAKPDAYGNTCNPYIVEIETADESDHGYAQNER